MLNNNKISFGIVQGRLSYSDQLQQFPQENWQKEFSQAKKIGYDFIEFLIEREHNPKNPFWSITGNNEINNLLVQNKLNKYSICLDYIINNKIEKDYMHEVNKYIDKFIKLSMNNNFKVVILPFLEHNELNENNLDFYSKFLLELSNKFPNIIFCIETLLDANNLLNLLNLAKSDNLKCVFDTGNRVLLSEDLNEDIFKLKDFIFHVHVKDKDKLGQNVMLTTGLVDFDSVLKSLKKINYKGPFVFETTRGKDPIKTAIENKDFINKKYMSLF